MSKPTPFAHQIVDTEALIREPAYALFCEPRLGKSRTVVDAAFTLWDEGRIDTLVAIAPADTRSVWADPSPRLGELAKWWPEDAQDCLRIEEFCGAKTRLPMTSFAHGKALYVLVSNPEMIRRPEHLERLRDWLRTRHAMIVFDESWQYQNPTADQTKAAWKLAEVCARRYVLNGTPGEQHQQYAQFRILQPKEPGIFPTKGWWQWRARYARMGGFQAKKIVGAENVAEFHALTAPYCVHRKTSECRDVKDPVRTQIEVPLSAANWKLYLEMRKDAIARLSPTAAATAKHAGAALIRLAQITNGFVGGVEETADLFDEVITLAPEPLREIGREKLDGLIRWLAHQDLPDKIVTFTRFRADVERTVASLGAGFTKYTVRPFYGGLRADDKRQVKELFAVDGDPTPAIAVINAQSGGAGLDLASAPLCIFLGHEYAHRLRVQAENRVQGWKQGVVTYLDILATGPNGERTIDHTILASQRQGEETAAWTRDQWRAALLTETGAVA